MFDAIRSVRQAKPFADSYGLYAVPPCKVVGLRFLHPPGKEGKWQLRVFVEETVRSALWQQVLALPSLMEGVRWGFTDGGEQVAGAFSYLLSVLVPESTPVPEGLEAHAVPQSQVAIGGRGERMWDVVAGLRAAGYVPAWEQPGCNWTAELYFREEEEEAPDVANVHWAVPCCLPRA